MREPWEERLAEIKKLLADIAGKSRTSHAAAMRETLIEDATRVRALLSALEKLDFAGRPTETTLENLAALRKFYADKVSQLPEDVFFPTTESWQDLVNDPGRKRAFQALEGATMQGLSKGLRRGSIWVSHSLSFRERDQMLIAPAVWNAERERHLSLLNLPKDPDVFLEKLLKLVEASLAARGRSRRKRRPGDPG